MAVKYEPAKDIQEMLDDVLDVLEWRHLIGPRIICIRSRGAKSRAYARIWAFPKIWQVALDLSAPFYVIEFLSENFDSLSEKNKIKTIIHEILHIPKSFGGGLLSHKQGKINRRTEVELFNEYKKKGGLFG
ncbi:MAG: putative metallopeptidase [Candidatus Anstonellales archaeon]